MCHKNMLTLEQYTRYATGESKPGESTLLTKSWSEHWITTVALRRSDQLFSSCRAGSAVQIRQLWPGKAPGGGGGWRPKSGVSSEPPPRGQHLVDEELERAEPALDHHGRLASNVRALLDPALQGYLAHKKPPPPRTLRWPCAWGTTVVLGGWRFLRSEVALRRTSVRCWILR